MSWVCVYVYIRFLPFYGLGKSHRGLYYPAQPPLFLGNIRFITRINIVTMWSGTARFRNPHIKWLEAMAGIPLELQVKKRKEGKKRE